MKQNDMKFSHHLGEYLFGHPWGIMLLALIPFILFISIGLMGNNKELNFTVNKICNVASPYFSIAEDSEDKLNPINGPEKDDLNALKKGMKEIALACDTAAIEYKARREQLANKDKTDK